MEKKQYYIVSPRNFANEYTLLYVENAADRAALPENAMRISYTTATKLCREENYRAIHDPACSGFASNMSVGTRRASLMIPRISFTSVSVYLIHPYQSKAFRIAAAVTRFLPAASMIASSIASMSLYLP